MRFHDFTEDMFDGVPSKKSSSNQPTVNEINTVKIEISKKILIDACVELVTVNGRPFSLIGDSGFQKILGPIKTGLARKTKDNQFSLGPESIQKYISKEANDLKLKIIEEVRNCMVSLKVDGVTRMDRSFLGINIQYTNNDQIVLRTLALKEIKSQHTGDNLKRIIMDVCSNFEISADQIYSITTDNGTNLLKAVKIIASENGDYDVIEIESDDSDNENEEVIEIVVEDDSNHSCNMMQTTGSVSELEFGDNEIFELFNYNFNNDAPSTSAISSNLKLNITGMRCAAHTLQLAVESTLKQEAQVGKLILEVRKVVKILRTQTFMYMLRKQKFKKPVLDCPTRWGSTFDMLKRLLELKEFCTEMEFTNFSKFKNFTESDWNRIVEIVSALEPARKCTHKLQYEQLTVGSFYGYWQECKLSTEKIGTQFSRILVKNMEERENKLLDNDVVLAGIFLDPRFKIVLGTDQMKRAKYHLKQLWSRLLALNEINSSDTRIDHSDLETDFETRSGASTSSSDEMEAFLKRKETERKVYEGLYNSGNSSSDYLLMSKRIENILNTYEAEQDRIRISKNSTIFEFWKKKKDFAPELYTLAQVLLGVPATQVSVERLFSGLKFLLPPTRANIKEKILEEQLFVRTNRMFGKKEEKKIFSLTKNKLSQQSKRDEGKEVKANENETAKAEKENRESENQELHVGKKRAYKNITNYFTKKSRV